MESFGIFTTIQKIISALKVVGLSYEIILVEDASPDGSSDCIEKKLKAFPEVKIIKNSKNLGFVETAKKGFSMCTGKHFWLSGGDCPYSFQDLQKLFSRLGFYDIVIPFYAHHHNRPFLRIVLSNLYTKLINLLTGCGLKYYNGSALYKRADLVDIFPLVTRFSYSAEILLTLINQGKSFEEVGLHYYETKKNSTALSVQNFAQISLFFLKLIFKVPLFRPCLS